MRKLKITGIVLSVILAFACVGIDAWWFSVKNYAPDKITQNVINVGALEATDGTKANVFEVNYYTNANKNGYEMFEFKINYLTDSNASKIYTQGLQYIANSTTDKLTWQVGNYLNLTGKDLKVNKKTEEGAKFFGNITHPREDYIISSEQPYVTYTKEDQAWFQRFTVDEKINSKYNYASGDQFETMGTIATNPINEDTRLTIQYKNSDGKNESFGLGFRGMRSVTELKNHPEKEMLVMSIGKITGWGAWWKEGFAHIYPYYDVDYLAYQLYSMCQGKAAGTNQYNLTEFGDIFNYYAIGKDNVFESIRLPDDTSGKVKSDFTSYYGVKINIVADGAQRASTDSMFKMIKGSENFNLYNDQSSEEYFYGRSVVKANLYDFEYVQVHENNYVAKLSESFLKRYFDYKGLIQLSIEIDKDTLKGKNIAFLGFADDSGLDQFDIYDCYTLETVQGQTVRTEVHPC